MKIQIQDVLQKEKNHEMKLHTFLLRKIPSHRITMKQEKPVNQIVY